MIAKYMYKSWGIWKFNDTSDFFQFANNWLMEIVGYFLNTSLVFKEDVADTKISRFVDWLLIIFWIVSYNTLNQLKPILVFIHWSIFTVFFEYQRWINRNWNWNYTVLMLYISIHSFKIFFEFNNYVAF